MDCTVHGILQARILEWGAFLLSRGSFQPRDQTLVSRIADRFFTSWATREAPMTINAYRNLRFQHFHGHLQLDQHGNASKRNRQTSKALVNEPFTVLQKSSKKIERYNYIKLSKLHLSFLYPSLPKFSYSLAASLNLPFCNFSPKIYKLYTKTFLKNISIISF